jgi:16S rRNA (guanine966-N2)-methyltransferase
MRVISGSARGTVLHAVKSKGTRPMTDRVKTSLFTILEPDLRGAKVVDMFAGTGSMGIEALSRGAEFCVFIEQSHSAVGTIMLNLEKTHMGDKAKVLSCEVSAGITRMVEASQKAAVVLFDPPFEMGKGVSRDKLKTLVTRIANEILEPGGLLVYHHEIDTHGNLGAPGLEIVDKRDYGRNVVTIFKRL